MRNILVPWPRFASAAGAALLAGALFGGCGGEEHATTGPGPIPVESLRAEYQAAACEYEVRCGLMPDKAACLGLDRTDGAVLQLLADVVFGSVGYDPAAARACVEATRARSCTSQRAAQASVDDACRGVFKGSVPEGGPCVTAGECSGDSVCDTSGCMKDQACCAGKCAPAPQKVPVGGDCSKAPCADDAYCDRGDAGAGGGGGAAATPTCQARKDNGEACAASDACKDGQRCAKNGSAGTCYILAKEGETCNPMLPDACLSFDTWCDPAASKCLKLPGAGAPCAGGSKCQAYAYCDGKSCRTRPVEGEACPDGGPPCLGDLECDNKVCTRPPAGGVCVPSEPR